MKEQQRNTKTTLDRQYKRISIKTWHKHENSTKWWCGSGGDVQYFTVEMYFSGKCG